MSEKKDIYALNDLKKAEKPGEVTKNSEESKLRVLSMSSSGFETISTAQTRISYYIENSTLPLSQSFNLFSSSQIQAKENSDSECNKYYDIHINDRNFHPLKKFPSNYVKTTKYTLLTFLPINLFHQVIEE
jgi:hypothetical protein